MYTTKALELVRQERENQNEKWGDQSDVDLFEWVSILAEEVGELAQEVNDVHLCRHVHVKRGGYKRVQEEAVQVAAVAIEIVEKMLRQADEDDRRSAARGD